MMYHKRGGQEIEVVIWIAGKFRVFYPHLDLLKSRGTFLFRPSKQKHRISGIKELLTVYYDGFLKKTIKIRYTSDWLQTFGWAAEIIAVSRIWIQLPLFYMPYFGRQGHSWNEATRQLSELLLHLRSRRHGEPPRFVQAKPYKAFNSASLQAFLGIPFFKVSEWIF